MTNLAELAPDIKISINQIFGIDTDMKVEGFSKTAIASLDGEEGEEGAEVTEEGEGEAKEEEEAADFR